MKDPASWARTLEPRPPNPSYRNPARTAAARPALHRPDRPRRCGHVVPQGQTWLAQQETPHQLPKDSDSAFLASPRQPAIRAWTLHSPSPGRPSRSGVVHPGGKGGGTGGPGSRAGGSPFAEAHEDQHGHCRGRHQHPDQGTGEVLLREAWWGTETEGQEGACGSGWSALRARAPPTLDLVTRGLRIGVAGGGRAIAEKDRASRGGGRPWGGVWALPQVLCPRRPPPQRSPPVSSTPYS